MHSDTLTFKQSTLNRWMQTIEAKLYNMLMSAMEKEIRNSRFIHNDETYILVRSKEDGTEQMKYKEYIYMKKHGNSPYSAILALF